MVDTERAFARMSEEQGTRPAFMAFIADDGILFSPYGGQGQTVDDGTSVAAIRQASLVELATNLRGYGARGRHGIHHRALGIQSRHSRRQAGSVWKLSDGVEKTTGWIVEVCD